MSDWCMEYVMGPLVVGLMLMTVVILGVAGFKVLTEDRSVITLDRNRWDCIQSHDVLVGKIIVQQCDVWKRV